MIEEALHRHTDTRHGSDANFQSAYFPGAEDRSFSSEVGRIFARADYVMNKPEFKRADTSLSTATTRMQYGTVKLRSSTPSEATKTVRSSGSSEQKSFEYISTIDSNSEPLNQLYCKKLQDSKELLDKLSLSYQRHVSMKKYCTTMQEQLRTSVQIAKQELRSRYDGLVAELSHKLEEAMSQLEVNAKGKESLLKERDNELDVYIQTILEAHQVLELKIRAEPKGKFVQHFMQTRKEAEEALEVWASDFAFDGDSCKVKCPEFCFALQAKSNLATDFPEKSKTIDRRRFVELDLKALDKKRKEIIARSRPFISIPDPELSSRTSTPTCTSRHANKVSDEEVKPRRKHASSSHRRTSRGETLKPGITERFETYRKDAIILDLVHKYKELESKYLTLKTEDKENIPDPVVSFGPNPNLKDLTEANHNLSERLQRLEQTLFKLPK